MTEPTVVNNTAPRGSFTEWSRTPLAIGLAIALCLAVLAALFIGLAKDHKSALQLCSENHGTYDAYTKVCTMPGVKDSSR
jgi:hypothetical protein